MQNYFFNAEPNDYSPPPVQQQWKQGNLILLLLFAAAALFVFCDMALLRNVEGEFALTRQLAGKGIAFYSGEYENYPQAPGTIFFCRQLQMLFQITSVAPLWVLRLLPALFALATVYMCYNMGKTLHSHRCGITAGWLMTGSYGFLYWGRTASAVTAGGFFALCAVWMLYGKKQLRWSFRRYWGMFMLLIISLFYSGIPLLILIFLLLMPKFFRKNSFRRHLKLRMWGALLCALICGILMLAVTFGIFSVLSAKEAWELFYSVIGNWGRHQMEYGQNLFIHDLHLSFIFNVPRLTVPWILFVIASIGALIKSKRLPLRYHRMLMGIMLAAAVSMTLPMLRWQHAYLLLPLLMVFTALGFESKYSSNFKWISLSDFVFRPLVILLAALLLALPLTAPLWETVLAVQVPVWMLILLPLSGILALVVLIRGRVAPREFIRWSGLKLKPGVTIVAMTVLMASLFMFGQPFLSRFRTGQDFWQQSRVKIVKYNADVLIYCGENPDMDALYYLDDIPVRKAADRSELNMLLKEYAGKRIMLTIRGKKREFPLPAGSKLSLQEKYPLSFSGKPITDRHELWELKGR